VTSRGSAVPDYRRFPARPVPTRPPVFRFRRSPAADRLPVAIVSVRQGGRLVERDLGGSYAPPAPPRSWPSRATRGVSEAYFRGHRHDPTVSSFSVAKPVVSALVGIAIAQGRIATGRTVSAYLSERLWGPLGMEADGSWSLDSRRSGLELLQAGLNGRAIDFAKLGALYLHGGAWRGRQLIPRRWVADSTEADTRTDPSPRFQYDWWTRPGTGPPTTSGLRATTASSSTCPRAATWSWSGSAPNTTTTTGQSCWPGWPAACKRN
jgi:CubicO group peptidase (beta-lactamase class C family)